MFLSVREETIQTNEQDQPIRYIIRERPASLKNVIPARIMIRLWEQRMQSHLYAARLSMFSLS